MKSNFQSNLILPGGVVTSVAFSHLNMAKAKVSYLLIAWNVKEIEA